MIAIGEIRKTITPYYDLRQGRMFTKSRPALIIAQADTDDYVVLPVSRISRQYNRDAIYDIEVNPVNYPLLNLNEVSYIRTHKQTVIHRAEIGDLLGELKYNYEDFYLYILELRERFSEEITNQAIC